MRARGIVQLRERLVGKAIEGRVGQDAYSKWKRPGNSETRRSPSKRTIVVSDVAVLLVDGIYLRLMDFW
jgi:hypothetical protein